MSLGISAHGAGRSGYLGNRRTAYTRMNLWSKEGVLDRVFEFLLRQQIARFELGVHSMESTSVKMHP